MNETAEEKARLRLLRFLASGDAAPREAAGDGRVLLDGGDRGTIGMRQGILREAVRDGLVSITKDRVALSETGRTALGSGGSPDLPFGTGRQQRESAIVLTPSGRETVTVNAAESPLALLRRRTGRNGAPFLSEREFRAGERLRADYSRGQIMPRMGINWNAAGGGGRKQGDGNGLAELTEAALAARQRVERAVEAVGPELAGVLIDVCCFLKGLERVEAERSWPVRSAKVVLKSALAALARHYEPHRAEAAGRAGAILHWGAADYRPRI